MSRVSYHKPGDTDLSMLETFRAVAKKCRTPRQFKHLLKQLHSFIPYRSLLCAWGSPSMCRISNILSLAYPKPFIRWYFTMGMWGKDPVFAALVRTQKPLIWSEMWHRFPHRFDPEFVRKVQEHQLEYSLYGSTIATADHHSACYFALVMASEKECRLYLEHFTDLLPYLSHAFHHSYPRSRLTERERTVLQLRAQGCQAKAIAAWLSISPRTVKKHIEAIKEKLYTNDLVNAVVIAMKLGMID